MHHRDVADQSPLDARLHIVEVQPHHSFERQADDSRAIDRVYHAIGLRQVHRHRFAEDDVLSGARAEDRELLELGNGRCEVNDVDLLSVQEFLVTGMTRNAERPRERIQLFLVVPRSRNELRFRMFAQRPRQSVGGIPVPQAHHGDSPFARHDDGHDIRSGRFRTVG